ncbi:MAG: TonB-dependent receptor [Bacteroidales bacterium]|nr:TonB-dependent receptor [Bacteroidales bacterium]
MKKSNAKQLSSLGLKRSALRLAMCVALAGTVGAPAMLAEPMVAAQQAGTITGVVLDSDGEPAIGANVKIKGAQGGVNTDIDGRFSIKAQPGDVLEITYLGMIPKEVKVGADSHITVQLESNSKVMDEVVVIGYGTQKKGDVTSAVSSVKAEDFTMGKIGDAAELVKGKIAGLSVTNSSGDPTASSSIMLRGTTTLLGSVTPLVLVDGVEGDLNTVAPENIAEINVLKDASAAAIYGTRGANGVILISTKTGRRDAPANITYSSYYSWTDWANTLDMMDTNDVIYGRTTFSYGGYDTDWLKAISRKYGFKHNHSLSVTGGSSNATYSANVTYSDEDGKLRKSDNRNIKMQVDYTQYAWNDILKFNFNVLTSRQKYSLNNNAYAYRQAINRNPSEPIYNSDGSYYENFNRLYYYNPVGIQDEYEGEAVNKFYQMAGNFTIEPIKGWKTNIMLMMNENSYESTSWTSPNHYSLVIQDDYNGSASQSSGNSRSDNIEITSNYHATFNGKHRFDALVGYSYLYNVYDNFYASNGNFSTTAFKWNNLGNGTLLTEEDRHAGMGSGKSDDKLIGFFGRISYGYDNRYNILASIRHEGSSKFGANNKWANFPSVSLGWNITNESFMEPYTSTLNNLRLRVGYGVTGITPTSSYLAQNLYDFAPYGDILSEEGSWIKTLEVSQNPNPDLKWETTHEWNFGLDYGLFNDRLYGTFDFYIKETHDLLYNYAVPVPPNLYAYTLANVGKMRNTGIELLITAIPVQTKDFSWTTTLTLSHNKNKLVSLSNDLYETDNFQEVGGLDEPIYGVTHCMEVGHSLGDYWGLKYHGLSANGVPVVEVKDANGNWVLKEWSTDDNVKENRQRLGTGMPKLYLGWGHTFFYKGIDLNLQFTGAFGYKILNEQRCFYENNNQPYNRLRSASDYHQAIDLDGNKLYNEDGSPMMVQLSSTVDRGFWSDHLEKGDFLKLSSVTLGYTLPLKGAITNYIKNCRIYASASNVFCITSYSGLDPEVDNYFLYPGIDGRDKYPTTRSYTVGLTVNF